MDNRPDQLNIYRYKKVKNLPVYVVISYLVLVLLLYAYGPFGWITYSPVLFYGLQIFYLLYFAIGYRIGLYLPERKKVVWSEKNDRYLMKYLLPLSIVNSVVILINMIRDFGYATMNLPMLFRDLLTGILNMGSSYAEHNARLAQLSGAELFGGSIMTLFNLLWGFAGFNILLLDLYYFKKSGIWLKVITIISCLETIVFYVAIGTNIGVFRIVIATAVFYVLNAMRKSCFAKNGSKKTSVRKMLLAGAAAFAVIVLYFVSTMKARGGDVYWSLQYCNIGGIGLDMDSVLFRICPESLYMAMISLSGYLTQGLYGFSMCTQLGWHPTFGLGNSMGMVDLISKHIVDVGSHTYQYRVQEAFGWDQKVQWCSMYSWIANDVGLAGVIIVMFFIGFLLAMIYRDSLTTENPFARILMVYFAIMCIFIPCNNQVMQSTYTLFSFLTALLAWVLTSRIRVLLRK